MASIDGAFYLKRVGRRRDVDVSKIKRTGREKIICRTRVVPYRVYEKVTDGADGDIQDMDAAELWFDPEDGQPDSIDDYLVSSAEIMYNVENGQVIVTVETAATPIAFDAVSTMIRGSIK